MICTATEGTLLSRGTIRTVSKPSMKPSTIRLCTVCLLHSLLSILTKSSIELDRPGGIQDQIGECQRLAMEADPNEYGDIEKVNKFCSSAREYAENFTTRPYLANGNNGWYDISHRLFNPGDPFPPEYLNVFLNQHWVQKALGVPVNHTASSETVHQAFTSTGDMARGGLLEDIAYLLDSGVKVALVYGDRDFACNWVCP